MQTFKLILKNFLIAFAALLVIYMMVMATLSLYTNFHVVIPNKVYRSAQLTPDEFNNIIKKYHIKTILNLRGRHEGRYWYTGEVAISKKDNVKHIDLALHAMGTVSKMYLQQLQKIIEQSKKPLLIHCQHGADRTGLASAMAIILLTHQPLTKAIKQTSSFYLAVDPRSTGKVEMALYKKWLKHHQYKNSAQHFKQWINQLSAL